ncbi:hypothetical protein [Streptomyces sp. NPDC047886]|uniref:hypothetical protein n=1 Tax=Streptomyces sp. NPDC047886 TaxID=3365490 RepID=UPI003715100A
MKVVAGRLSRELGIAFQVRESAYRGGEYFLFDLPSGGEVSVERNYEDEEGFLMEADFPDFSTLVYLSDVEDSTVVAVSRLSGFVELRREEL